MSEQDLAEKSLAGIADILPPLAPDPLPDSLVHIGTTPVLIFVVIAIITAVFVWRWRTGTRYRLLRLARICESGYIDSRDAAHQLATELDRYSKGGRLSEHNPPQGVAIDSDSWSRFLSTLASQCFGPQAPDAHLVAQSIRQAERWLRGAHRVE